MGIKSNTLVKEDFQNGQYPAQPQFEDLVDSVSDRSNHSGMQSSSTVWSNESGKDLTEKLNEIDVASGGGVLNQVDASKKKNRFTVIFDETTGKWYAEPITKIVDTKKSFYERSLKVFKYNTPGTSFTVDHQLYTRDLLVFIRNDANTIIKPVSVTFPTDTTAVVVLPSAYTKVYVEIVPIDANKKVTIQANSTGNIETITHNMNLSEYFVFCKSPITNVQIFPLITFETANTVSLEFPSGPNGATDVYFLEKNDFSKSYSTLITGLSATITHNIGELNYFVYAISASGIVTVPTTTVLTTTSCLVTFPLSQTNTRVVVGGMSNLLNFIKTGNGDETAMILKDTSGAEWMLTADTDGILTTTPW